MDVIILGSSSTDSFDGQNLNFNSWVALFTFKKCIHTYIFSMIDMRFQISQLMQRQCVVFLLDFPWARRKVRIGHKGPFSTDAMGDRDAENSCLSLAKGRVTQCHAACDRLQQPSPVTSESESP